MNAGHIALRRRHMQNLLKCKKIALMTILTNLLMKNKFLNQKRIEYAKSLLLDPELAVTEVAAQSGFSSLSAFLRMFKQLNLCTPTEFRSMYDSQLQKKPASGKK